MANRNRYDARCSVCHVHIRASEGLVQPTDARPPYRILCPEHVAAGSLDPPRPIEASKLPSIHLGDERFER
jgi:ferredoxin